jgi:hypothetical protein
VVSVSAPLLCMSNVIMKARQIIFLNIFVEFHQAKRDDVKGHTEGKIFFNIFVEFHQTTRDVLQNKMSKDILKARYSLIFSSNSIRLNACCTAE